MVDVFTPPKQEVQITDSAKNQIVNLTSSDNKYLRLGIKGGGCSGFEYVYDLHSEDNLNEDDYKFKVTPNAYLVIDTMSMFYILGSTLDYKVDLMGSMFVIENPQVTMSCGCGQSIGF